MYLFIYLLWKTVKKKNYFGHTLFQDPILAINKPLTTTFVSIYS